MRSMIESFECIDIVMARDGAEAIEAIRLKQFDIILCDYNLGAGQDGQQVMEEAKFRNIYRSSTVFIMVTAENTAQMVMGALEYQPDAYLSKPVNRKVLQSRLESLLRKKENLKQIYMALDDEQYTTVLQLCDRYLETHTKNRFELLKIKSTAYLKTGAYDEAESLCRLVLDERDILWAMFDLGKVYFLKKSYQQALEMFEKVIETNAEFIAAYDWLAKAQQAMGNNQDAQATLEQAIEKSPKSLLRQRALAEMAEKNNDLAATERARRKAVTVGRGSVLREPGDFTSLAKVQAKNEGGKEALNTINAIKDEFKDQPKARFEAMVSLSTIYEVLGDDVSSKKSLDRALAIAKKDPSLVSGNVGLEIAKNCMQNGKKEEANHFFENIIKNNHEDDEMLARVAEVFQQAGNESEGLALINDTKQKIIEINNNGVNLLREGKIEESIELFTRAADGMPRNPVINLNAAQSMIIQMKKSGPRLQDIQRVLQYIHVAKEGGGNSHEVWIGKLMAETRLLRESL